MLGPAQIRLGGLRGSGRGVDLGVEIHVAGDQTLHRVGVAHHIAAVAVERGSRAAGAAVLGDEIDAAVGHVHILQHVAYFVVVDLLVHPFVVAAVLVEIDDRTVFGGHVALHEHERTFGVGEVEHIILLRQNHLVGGAYRQHVFQIHSLHVFGRRCDSQTTAGNIQIDIPAGRHGGYVHGRNPPFGRK